jgi:hypothetical protein
VRRTFDPAAISRKGSGPAAQAGGRQAKRLQDFAALEVVTFCVTFFLVVKHRLTPEGYKVTRLQRFLMD